LAVFKVQSLKILVLGCGNIGSVAARDLAQSLPFADIVVADISERRAKEAASRISRQNVSSIQADVYDKPRFVSTLKNFDIAVAALPGEVGYHVCKSCITAGVDLVDVSYMPEDVMTLQESASKAQITIVPDCGMSPGLGNILVGHGVSRLDQVESVHLLNGGLPERRIPPLDYVVTWSARDLIDMYMRKVCLVMEGKTVEVEPMSGLEELDFPHVGKLEAFYTDGLRTLLYTVKDAREMWEKTLRYPGHVEKVKLLKSLGFFDEEPLKVAELSVSPKELTARLLEDKLGRMGVPDIVIMKIIVSGEKGSKKLTYSYYLFDRYDEKQRVTSMARTTAYTTSITAQLLAKKVITERGVVPPEKLGMNEQIYCRFISMMKDREITIEETAQYET
jgi:lysine 6-dehydrogenase